MKHHWNHWSRSNKLHKVLMVYLLWWVYSYTSMTNGIISYLMASFLFSCVSNWVSSTDISMKKYRVLWLDLTRLLTMCHQKRVIRPPLYPWPLLQLGWWLEEGSSGLILINNHKSMCLDLSFSSSVAMRSSTSSSATTKSPPWKISPRSPYNGSGWWPWGRTHLGLFSAQIGNWPHLASSSVIPIAREAPALVSSSHISDYKRPST